MRPVLSFNHEVLVELFRGDGKLAIERLPTYVGIASNTRVELGLIELSYPRSRRPSIAPMPWLSYTTVSIVLVPRYLSGTRTLIFKRRHLTPPMLRGGCRPARGTRTTRPARRGAVRQAAPAGRRLASRSGRAAAPTAAADNARSRRGRTTEIRSTLGAVAEFVVLLWRQPILDTKRESLFMAVLDAVALHKKPDEIIRHLQLSLKTRFRLNPLPGRRVLQVLLAWRSLKLL